MVDSERSSHILPAVTVLFLLVLVPVLLASDYAAAGSAPKPIYGYVYDSSLAPVSGATVLVQVYVGAGPTVRSSLSTASDSGGFYTVTFDPMNWEIGDKIKVTATKGLDSGSAATTATGDPTQQVDVTISTVVPEFESPALAAVGMLAVVCVAVILTKKRARTGE